MAEGGGTQTEIWPSQRYQQETIISYIELRFSHLDEKAIIYRVLNCSDPSDPHVTFPKPLLFLC